MGQMGGMGGIGGMAPMGPPASGGGGGMGGAAGLDPFAMLNPPTGGAPKKPAAQKVLDDSWDKW